MNNDKLIDLFDNGGTLLIFGMPPQTEFGMDMESWQVGEKFKGVKMIPPGLHFIYFSATSKTGETAPRTGFFHIFKKGEVVVKNYSSLDEDLTDENDTNQVARIKMNLKSFDANLGPYPYDTWSKWVSFTQHIKESDLLRLQPLTGRICSVPELINKNKRKLSSISLDEMSVPKTSKAEACSILNTTTTNEIDEAVPDLNKLPDMEPIPGTELRFSKFPDKPYKDGASPNEVSKGNLDSSYVLQSIIMEFEEPENLLGELQFAFVCFLNGQVWEAWEHWRKLVMTLCRAEEFLKNNSSLYFKFLSILHYQIEEVPEDLFTDIVESNNFLVTSLTNLFANIDDNSSDLSNEFVQKANRFKSHLTLRFKWNLTLCEEGDDAPVVVDL